MISHHLLTDEQNKFYKTFCDFSQEKVKPNAESWDKARAVPREIIRQCCEAGFVGGIIPKEFGGGGWDTVTFGILNEAIGSASSSLCALFTVQTMVAMTLVKWGTPYQQKQYLEQLATGEMIASFAMTEPKVGSDIQAIETTFTPKGEKYLLNGTKKWITFSGIADIFLVFGKTSDEKKALACIIRSDAPGVKVTRLEDMLGFRGAYLSQLEFDQCEIEPEDLVGKPGFALSYVAPFGLHYGRISTAWSSVGLIRACLETAADFAKERQAFGKPIMDHSTLRELVTDIGVSLEAATHLCLNAAKADDAHLPEAMEKALIAKYFASRAAARTAADTIQIMGAAGCYEGNHASRYYRNAKIMEIIEGTNQVLQEVLGKSYYKKCIKGKS